MWYRKKTRLSTLGILRKGENSYKEKKYGGKKYKTWNSMGEGESRLSLTIMSVMDD